MEVRVVLAFGSNLGDRMAHLREGVRGAARFVRVAAVSGVFSSAPVGFADQPDFLNAVLTGTTGREPREVLDAAHRLEAAAGRERSFRDAPRELDVDLVLYGGLKVRAPDLMVPHPRWKERAFVLGPLAEIAPQLVDPETGRSVKEIWAGRRDGFPPLERIAPPEALWRTSS